MQIKELTNYLESLAPLSTQESYDNSGLIVGDASRELTKVLLSLDCLETTVDEAIELGAEMIVSHHPILFASLKSLTGKNYVERVLLKAIKNDIAIYAIHTNYDNFYQGVNFEIAERLAVAHPKVLQPMSQQLKKLVVFVPSTHLEVVSAALFAAGAGKIGNYDACSFQVKGTGTFRAHNEAQPFVGKVGEIHREEEVRLEVVVENHLLSPVVASLLKSHPYEEVAYDIYEMENLHPQRGAGMIGKLDKPLPTEEFLQNLKQIFGCGVIRHTEICIKEIQTVAWCGGSGFFLLKAAMRAQADVYITGDVKYHEFFDADGQIILADIGHYESEQFTIHRLSNQLKKKFPNFAFYFTNVKTNPINYL